MHRMHYHRVRVLALCALAAVGSKAIAQQAPAAASADVSAQITALTEQFSAALKTNNTAVLDSMTASNMSVVRPNGERQTRSQWMASFTGGTQKFTSHDIEEVTVRVHGTDVAIAVSRNRVTGTGHSGSTLAPTNVTTRIWVLRDGRWQVVQIVVTPINQGAR